MADTCPTCGSPVEVVSSDEGTSFYAPDLEHASNPVISEAPRLPTTPSLGGPSYMADVERLYRKEGDDASD